MNSRVFIFFGRSGSGKGTQAELLIKSLNTECVYIETGEEFRNFMNQPNYTSGRVKEVLDEGGLLPEFLPIWVWTSALVEKFDGKKVLVFDGMSRRQQEAPVVDGALDFYGIEERYVIYLNVSKDWSREHLMSRGRYDDEKEDIDNKLEWYEKNTEPAIDYFRKNDKYKFLDINGEQTIEEVHKSIVDAIKG